MANSLPMLPLLFTLLLVSTICANVSAITKATSLVEKDIVPCTMCVECENPCQPLAPPPPPVIECPPPPFPSPPPPPPPPSPLPPAIVECPPPPKSSCPYNCETPSMPWTPPRTPQFPYYGPPYHDMNSGGKIMLFPALLFLPFILLVYLGELSG